MKSSTMNVETPINEEVFHEVSESYQGESSLSSLNDDVQQSLEEVIPPQTNTQSISISMVPNGDESSTSHNVFNERLKDAYFDAIRIDRGGSLSSQIRASPSNEKGNSNNLTVVLGTSRCLNVDVTLLKKQRWLCGSCLSVN
nr:hypothetical protein [Tanacetum cinerariifolium]